jgi:hypothetical protein
MWTRRDEKREFPRLEEFLNLRFDFEVYKIVYEHFIPAISSSSYYKEEMETRMSNAADNRELFSKSDEAFALLLLENYYDRWTDIFKKSDGKILTHIRGREKKINSNVRPRYTSGGNIYMSSDSSVANAKVEKGKGWNLEGYKRFNVLFDKVLEDRKKSTFY